MSIRFAAPDIAQLNRIHAPTAVAPLGIEIRGDGARLVCVTRPTTAATLRR
jgi:hypothetical protein